MGDKLQDDEMFFSTKSIPHFVLKSNGLPRYLAALSHKEGCKNRFYRQKRPAFVRKNEKIFWQSVNDKPHSRQRMLAKPIFKLCYSSSKSGRFIWRSGNHYSTKHSTDNARNIAAGINNRIPVPSR